MLSLPGAVGAGPLCDCRGCVLGQVNKNTKNISCIYANPLASSGHWSGVRVIRNNFTSSSFSERIVSAPSGFRVAANNFCLFFLKVVHYPISYCVRSLNSFCK